ncbi:hypothetical protein IC614_07760 [Allosphingosinicella flava]|uniref:DUF4440 domain-containing protein n=1 Tax=Allosphingosinicella flava TaxID=2771430 RepID=A0A7T2GIQ1_9SPHN|nr:hypothetical protein [Sphingosinicella flava]QPQ54258.1 hypothetical protein IC614_07760 [Sphingosinicella flava]
MRLWTLGAVAALALGAPATADPVTADPVVAAERAFAARHQEVPMKQAFQEFSAADGVAVTRDGVKNVKDFIATWPDANNPGFIQWWPTLAGIAQSGDLGFTTGPASFGGKRYSDYFTVWKKQPDGSWKWVIDQGTGPRPAAVAPTQNVAAVPVSTLPPMEAGAAWSDLQKTDGNLGRAFAVHPGTATYYAPEIRLLGYRPEPVDGIQAALPVLAGRARDLKTSMEGGGVSAAGDLGYTYGIASWSENGAAKTGPYLRVWQRRPQGWMVLVENVNPF